MNYPCGIIRDLLPLYIDDVCNEESKQAVQNHLSECEKCRNYYESMKSTEGFVAKENDNSEDMKMANSLKNVKNKINKKIRNIILCSVAAVLICILGFHLLFNAAIKTVEPSEVKVSAEVYPISELPYTMKTDEDSVEISMGEDDESDMYYVQIPAMPDAQISISENVMANNEYATVITTSSDYVLKEIIQSIEGDTLKITAFRTTILNNKAKNYQTTMNSLEFREINKIVYVEDDGTETVLWSK